MCRLIAFYFRFQLALRFLIQILVSPWEGSFVSCEVRSQVCSKWFRDDSDLEISDEPAASNEPTEPVSKVTLLKEAAEMLDDLTVYLIYENLLCVANTFAKVVSEVKAVSVDRKRRASVQREITDFFKWLEYYLHCEFTKCLLFASDNVYL